MNCGGGPVRIPSISSSANIPAVGFQAFYLLMLKDGVEYKKDSKGNPILPLFRLASSIPPPTGKEAPVYDHNGALWKSVAAPAAPDVP